MKSSITRNRIINNKEIIIRRNKIMLTSRTQNIIKERKVKIIKMMRKNM